MENLTPDTISPHRPIPLQCATVPALPSVGSTGDSLGLRWSQVLILPGCLGALALVGVPRGAPASGVAGGVKRMPAQHGHAQQMQSCREHGGQQAIWKAIPFFRRSAILRLLPL